MSHDNIAGYAFGDAEPEHTRSYLWAPVEQILAENRIRRLFDLGCGNGAFARRLAAIGCDVTGVDPSTQGIQHAREQAALAGHGSPTGPGSPKLSVGNAYEPLYAQFGTFPCVVSLEVVEHVYSPRMFAKCIAELLEPGGLAVVSTPYHGYWKNLALAITGRMDSHFTALWDHGHIKFWSPETLSALFAEQGMMRERLIRVGRLGPLAKSMIGVFRRQ